MAREPQARRRARWSAAQHRIRESQRRERHLPAAAELEPVVAHDPRHENGCLRCFVARMEEQRP